MLRGVPAEPMKLALLASMCLAACTPVGSPTQKRSAITFDDTWTASGYPCDAEASPFRVSIKQRGVDLLVTAASSGACVALGSVLLRSTLPSSTLTPLHLPLSCMAELTTYSAEEPPITEDAQLSVLSADRMVVDSGDVTIVLVRGAREQAGNGGDSGAGRRSAQAGAGRDARASGTGGESDSAANGGDAGDSGSPPGQPPGGAGQAGTRSGKPAKDAGGSGGAGSGGSAGDAELSAGAGGETTAAGSSGVSGPLASASAGADAGGSLKWDCLDVPGTDSCGCVEGDGSTGDLCRNPKPTCCFTLVALGRNSCQCYPPSSDTCLNYQQQAPDAQLVATCPPP